MENDKPEITVSVCIILFILIVITAIAFYDIDQKILKVKDLLFIYTNRVDSLIKEENENHNSTI